AAGGGGDVAAVLPLVADVDAVADVAGVLEAEHAEQRGAGLEALGRRVGIDAAEDVEEADAAQNEQHQRHQPDEAEDAAEVDLEALDRLGEHGVDGLLADVGGDAEGGHEDAGEQQERRHGPVDELDVGAELVLVLDAAGDEPAAEQEDEQQG